MKIYQTDAALGYRQLAFLIRLDKTKHGYNYICIGTQFIDDSDTYTIGSVVEDLEDIYVTESTFSIEDSPLYGTYLFDYFISNYNKNN